MACGHRSSASPDVAPRALPPPPTPTDVLLTAHFGQPRTTVDALSQVVGSRIPFELGLALVLGVDSTVLAASDTSQPIDFLVTGTAEHPEVVFALTPGPANQFRSTLGNRFRLVRVETLGERLDPQNAGAGAVRGTRCAIVGVPGPVPSRIVCSSHLESLERVGRYAAYQSQRLSGDHHDVIADVDGATARTAIVPMLQHAIDENTQSLAASAADERRRHDRAPDLGDPEAALGTFTTLARSLVHELDDVQHLTMRASVAAEAVTVESDLTLDAHGHGMFAGDALSRVGVDLAHPLAMRLPTDAFAAFASHTQHVDRNALVDAVASSVIGVVGTRVADPEAARRDVDALFAQLGDETAASISHEPDGGFEVTALFTQRDDGTAARAALATLAAAPWLRNAHFGDTGIRVALAQDVLTLRAIEAHAAPHAHAPAATDAGTSPSAPEAPRVVSISVSGNVLAIVVGAQSRVPAAEVVSPAALTGTTGSFVAGADLSGLVNGGGADERAVLHASYSAERTGERVVGHAQMVLPPAMIRSAMHGALPGGR